MSFPVSWRLVVLASLLASCDKPIVPFVPSATPTPLPTASPTPRPIDDGVDDPRGLALDDHDGPWLVNGASGSVSPAGEVRHYDASGMLLSRFELGSQGGPCAWDAGARVLWTVTSSPSAMLWRLAEGASASFPLGDAALPMSLEGMAVDAGGSVWISDSANDRLLHYQDGTLVSARSTAGLGGHPAGLAVRGDMLWVALRASTSVLVVPRASGSATTRELAGTSRGAIAVDPSGDVWANHAFVGTQCVTKLTAGGTARYELYSAEPVALAADARGFVWAVLHDSSQVVRLTPKDGTRTLYEDAAIVRPVLVAVDSSSNAWIASPGAPGSVGQLNMIKAAR